MVLTGGASRRMGRDKATLEVNGRPLARVAADALRDAGAAEVLAIGGDEAALTELGLRYVADGWPGEGPLAGVITALDGAQHDRVVILSCDLPDITGGAVTELLAALTPDVDAVVAVAGARTHPLVGVYRRGCRSALRRTFDTGERRMRAGLAALTVGLLTLSRDEWVRNVNFPNDLA